MWINQRYSVSDQQQDSSQQIQISFRSGRMAYLILIYR